VARVIVTRPAAQAEPWVRRLAACGIDAVALPLIEIVPAVDTAPIAAAWRTLAARRLVVFVSANAVLQFFAARPAGAPWPASVLAAAPGPGTAAALREQGVDPAGIVEPAADSAQLDSEALWQRLAPRDWRDAQVLVVRGDGGREWLADRLIESGAAVDHVAAYRRQPPQPTPEMRARLEAAFADPAAHLWLFSSAEAIHNLQTIAGTAWNRQARAIATHPRIAARARQAGFASVSEVSPALDAVVRCIQSLQP
jgi:uroporphyrinogen-III synthase